MEVGSPISRCLTMNIGGLPSIFLLVNKGLIGEGESYANAIIRLVLLGMESLLPS